MSTPDFTGVSTKLSPFGSGINKSLLTPCRRIGLSRKKNTPFSIAKLSTDEAGKSSTYNHSPTTPVTTKKTLSRKRSRVKFESSTSLSISKDVSDGHLVSSPVSVKSFQKKSFTKKFSEGSFSEKNSVVEDEDYEGNCILESLLESSDNHDTSITEPLFHLNFKVEAENEIEEVFSKNNSDIEKEHQSYSRISEKTRINNIINYPDDNLQINAETVSKPESIESFKSKNIRLEKLHTTSKSRVKENLRECKISIQKLGNDINNIENHKTKNINLPENESDDELMIGKIKKRRMVISSDDEDDFCTVPRMCKIPARDYKSKGNIKNKIKELNSPKIPIKKATLSPTVSHMSDEDDFTSTPDQDRVQKKDLVFKIKTLEAEVKEKRIKLENLKQASVYKTKHNIEDLMKLVGIWKKGCVLGLNALLSQLQSHGPIDMPMLLNNLQIPNEIVAKLCLNIPENN